jgi:hypothetical protein
MIANPVRAIGEANVCHEKFELDSVRGSLYRLRIRERTAIERTTALIKVGSFLVSPSLKDLQQQKFALTACTGKNLHLRCIRHYAGAVPAEGRP